MKNTHGKGEDRQGLCTLWTAENGGDGDDARRFASQKIHTNKE